MRLSVIVDREKELAEMLSKCLNAKIDVHSNYDKNNEMSWFSLTIMRTSNPDDEELYYKEYDTASEVLDAIANIKVGALIVNGQEV